MIHLLICGFWIGAIVVPILYLGYGRGRTAQGRTAQEQRLVEIRDEWDRHGEPSWLESCERERLAKLRASKM